MFDRQFPNTATRKRFRAGETIFRRGAKTANFHWVRSGRVRLTRTLLSGAEITLATAFAGQSFAEAALFSKSHHCNAVADADSEIACVPIAAIHTTLAEDPNFAKSLLATFARQVRDLRGAIEVRNIRRADDRLLAWLEVTAQGTPPTVKLSRPWASVATEIGLTAEATYRALAALERAEHIERPTPQSVVLKNINAAPATNA